MPRYAIVFILFAASSLWAGERVHVVVALAPSVEAQSRGVLTTLATVRDEVLRPLQSAGRSEMWGTTGVFEAEVDAGDVEVLRRDSRVRAVTIDRGGEGAMLESLPLIGIDVARAQGLDGSGVTVALLDSGIDTDHRDFAGRIVTQQCFCDNLDGTGCCPAGDRERSGDGAAEDDNGHGTHVAGIVAGGGAVAPRGIAPKARIIAVKVLDSANAFRSFTQVYRALDWLLREHREVAVINMSLSSYQADSPSGCSEDAIAIGLEPVIAQLRAGGTLITAASGNRGATDSITVPACIADVLAVGATFDADFDTPLTYANGVCLDAAPRVDRVTCFSNSSASLDLLAPGAMIVSSMRNGGFSTLAGTSMAAPHVAGAIALMVQRSQGKLSADAVESILKLTGKPVTDPRNGLTFPRLDLGAAIAATPKAEDPKKRRSAKHASGGH
jgi:subtilisin family serine protease